MPARLFTVSNESWAEHRKAGVAAINDPAADDPNNPHLLPIRDKVMAEISGIRKSTRLYFYRQQEKTISGGFVATTALFLTINRSFQAQQLLNIDFRFVWDLPRLRIIVYLLE
jgi:hypothetical protein